MKIVKAYAVLEPTLHQSVTEAGWLDSIKQRVGLGQPAPKQAQPAQPEPPDVARPTATSEADDPLGHVVGSILKPVTSGQTRFVLKLDRGELTSLYLKNDANTHLQLAKQLLGVTESAKYSLISLLEDPATGEPNDPNSVQAAQADLAKAAPATAAKPAQPKAAPKAKPKATAKPKSTAPVKALPAGYKFSDLISNNNGKDYTVLLDVPQQLAKAYQANPTPETLAQMMNHKYYAATISNSRAQRIAQYMDKAAGDIDAEAVAFNPDIIVNYPAAQTIKQAKLEWNKAHADVHNKMTNGDFDKSATTVAPTAQPAADQNPSEPAATKQAPTTPAETPPTGETAGVTAAADSTPPNTVNAAHDSLLALSRKFAKDDPNRKILDKALQVIKLMQKATTIK